MNRFCRSLFLNRELLAKSISKELFNGQTPVSLVSDHVIFPGSGTAVLRHSYGIPGIIGEASFFTNAEEEQRSLELFTRSSRSLPDSWLAGQAHSNRAKIFEMLDKQNKAGEEKRRIKEHYILPDLY